MMVSKNAIAITVVFLEAFLSALGVQFETDSVAHAVEGLVYAFSLALLIWNQLDREDVNMFFFKK